MAEPSTPMGIEEWIYTLNSLTGAVVKVERGDKATGQRRELSQEEYAALSLQPMPSAADSALEEWIYTLNRVTSAVVKVERGDKATGQRRELSQEEYAALSL